MTENNDYTYHVPVLLKECIEGLAIQPNGIYIDLTFGGGGHSRVIFKSLSSEGQLIAFDQDPEAKNNVWEAANFHFVSSNFAYLKNQLRLLGITKVDGILADLGVSSHQFNTPKRGFSIRTDERLDMRMNTKNDKSAFEIINQYKEEDLLEILRNYSDLKSTYRIVEKIMLYRKKQPINTTGELIEILTPIAPKRKENKFYAQVFQAIRIEVNDEMDTLKQMLTQTAEVLHPNGRIVVMSYHSLEDRLVKNYLKRGSFDGSIDKDFYGNIHKPFTEINRKPIIPNGVEIEKNSRARSAKLRIGKKNEGE